jgi:hypothetical protein
VTLRKPGQDAILTADDIAFIRQTLVSCTFALAWAGAHAGPDYQHAVADITERAGRSRTAGSLYYDACLAIDYLDFAGPAGSTR